jgi:hypothetical protein
MGMRIAIPEFHGNSQPKGKRLKFRKIDWGFDIRGLWL